MACSVGLRGGDALLRDSRGVGTPMIFRDISADVEAHQWDGTEACLKKMRLWFVGQADCPPGPNMVAPTPDRPKAEIGTWSFHPGDWMFKTIDGEFFYAEAKWFPHVYREST
jgi:hypothetical protein